MAHQIPHHGHGAKSPSPKADGHEADKELPMLAPDFPENYHEYLNGSLVICSHVADRLDSETVRAIAKKHGIDLEHTTEEKKKMRKDLKKRIKAWKKCPCRMDFRNVCQDQAGNMCPVTKQLLTPQAIDPKIQDQMSNLPPGTIGIGRQQVAIHTGGKFPCTNDPHVIELGKREDGRMCVTIQYAPDPAPAPEYYCTTIRETQATIVEEKKKDDAKGAKPAAKGKGKGKKGKK